MKLQFLAVCSVCFLAVPATAQDAIIIDKMNDSIVSGTVTKIQGESLFIDSTGRMIEVKLDDLDIDNVNTLFAPGAKVTAKGNFDDDGHTPVFDATEIIRSEGGTLMNSEALLLNED